MKKRFRGYDVKQVDELINSLQNQNEALVAKIANLTMQLTAAESNTENEDTIQSLNDKMNQIQEQLIKAEQEKQSAENSLTSLSLANEELKRKVQEMAREHDEEQNASFKIGSICSRAYSDMEKVKLDVSQEMLRQVEEYTDKVNESNDQMLEALNSINDQYNNMLGTFAANLEDIFYKLKCIETGRTEIEQSLLPTQKIAEELKMQVSESIKQSIYSQKQEAAEVLGRYGMAPQSAEGLPSKEDTSADLLNELRKSVEKAAAGLKENTAVQNKKLERESLSAKIASPKKPVYKSALPVDAAVKAKATDERIPANKVIGIRTNITADDVFGSNTGSD